MLTETQITLVKQSFLQVADQQDAVAEMFYGRLFEQNPDYRALFKGDMHEQGIKLMQMLAVVVSKLNVLDEIVPAVRELAIRHVAYGIHAEDYHAVGAALLWTLRQGLGDAFTSEVEDAWAMAYTILSQTMIEAAYPDAVAAN